MLTHRRFQQTATFSEMPESTRASSRASILGFQDRGPSEQPWGSILDAKGSKMQIANSSGSIMTLDELIGFQTVAGSFEVPTKNRASLLRGNTLEEEVTEKISRTLQTNGDESSIAVTIYMTLLVVVIIEKRFPDSKEMWSLVVQKARDWVDALLEDPKMRLELELSLREDVE
jgi:hypothetical protein